MDAYNWHVDQPHNKWVVLSIPGARPLPRYKHAAAVVDDKLYISGGSRNGRYLSEFQVLNLRSLTWSSLNLKQDDVRNESGALQDGFPAMSGHSMIRWGQKLLLLGGNSKHFSEKIIVYYIDVETSLYGVIETPGYVPVARTGHSATLAGSRLIIFGGEDRNRKLLNDVLVLDLDSMTWTVVNSTQTPPAPRFDHAAAVHAERYLLIFGGCSHSVFFNDLHILDLETMEWSQPQLQGDLVTPRAGHSGVTIDEHWYIAGGGDNKSGCSDTILLNMSKQVWSVLTTVTQRDPLASEGLSICSATIDEEKYLVAFGGYNGRYSNEVFAMRLKQRESSQPKIFQSSAAAAAAASVTAAYALAKSEKLDVTLPKDIYPTENGYEASADVEAIKDEKNALLSSLEEARSENSRLRIDIDELSGTHAELSRELQSVQAQLVAERSRCFKLEAQIIELKKTLEATRFVEDQVQALRREKSELDKKMDLESVKRQGSTGVWGWMSGASGDK